ncbi:MAG: diadenylate cyclase CdaA [Syntrophothermus sp.]
MIPLFLTGFFDIRIVDVIDVILFSFLLYEVYNLIKGTTGIRIFTGIILVYLIWIIVRIFQMQLLSEILGQFISVGVIALIVVFQPEIRQFLLMVGNTRIIKSNRRHFLFWKYKIENPVHAHVGTLVKACKKMADTGTGALLVINRQNELKIYKETGQPVDARISETLIETIFFKNSPMHDGAMIITGGTIRAARCILPVSGNTGIPARCGLRHRAGVGITEKSDAITIIVSEERGTISYSVEGQLKENVSPSELSNFLEEIFME